MSLAASSFKQNRNVTADDDHKGRQRIQAAPLKLPTMAAFRQKFSNLCEEEKSLVLAYILLVFLGLIGAHHFYLGRYRYGVMYMLTFGLCGFGYFVDLFRLPGLVESVNNDLFAEDEELDKRCNSDAYILWFPCGIIGFHHFYLGNFHLGILYFLTFGVYGIGWIIDFFRIPSLVATSNIPPDMIEKSNSQTTTFLMVVSPLGILGAHHYYLGRWKWGLLYTCTGGVFIFGWLFDMVRVPSLVSRENKKLRGENSHKIYIDDVYLLWLSFGLFGAHHYFLERKSWFLLYLFTFGLFGCGWILDLFRIPCFVLTKNNHSYKENCIDNQVVTFAPTIYKTDTNKQENIAEMRRQNFQSDLSCFLKRNGNAFSETCNHEHLVFEAIPSPILKQRPQPFKTVGKLRQKKSPKFLETTVESFTLDDDSDENVISRLATKNEKLSSVICDCTLDLNAQGEITKRSKKMSKEKNGLKCERSINVNSRRSSNRILRNSVTSPDRNSAVTDTESGIVVYGIPNNIESDNFTSITNHTSDGTFVCLTSTPRHSVKEIDNSSKDRCRNREFQTSSCFHGYSDTVNLALTDKRVNSKFANSFSNESKSNGHYLHKVDTTISRTSENKIMQETNDLRNKHSKGLSVSFVMDDIRQIDGVLPEVSDVIDRNGSCTIPRTRKRKKRNVRSGVSRENCGEIVQNTSNNVRNKDTTTPCRNTIAAVTTIDQPEDLTNCKLNSSSHKSFTDVHFNGINKASVKNIKISALKSKTLNNTMLNPNQTDISTSDTEVKGQRNIVKRNKYLHVNSLPAEKNMSPVITGDLDWPVICRQHSKKHSKHAIHYDARTSDQDVKINGTGFRHDFTCTAGISNDRPTGGIAKEIRINNDQERSGGIYTRVKYNRDSKKIVNGAEEISNEEKYDTDQVRKSRKRSRRSGRATATNSEPNYVIRGDEQTSHCSRLSNSFVNNDHREIKLTKSQNDAEDDVNHDNSIVRRSAKKATRATEVCINHLEARRDQREKHTLRKNTINASQSINIRSPESKVHGNLHTSNVGHNAITTPRDITKVRPHNVVTNTYSLKGAIQNGTAARVDQGRQEFMKRNQAAIPTVQIPLSARELMQNLEWDSDDDIL